MRCATRTQLTQGGPEKKNYTAVLELRCFSLISQRRAHAVDTARPRRVGRSGRRFMANAGPAAHGLGVSHVSTAADLASALADSRVTRIVVAKGIYTVAEPILVRRSVTIEAVEAGTVLFDAQATSSDARRVFDLSPAHASDRIVLAGFNITGGVAEDDTVAAGGTTSFRDLSGAGVRVGSGNVTLSRCRLFGNLAAHGAALFVDGGSVVVDSCELFENQAQWGGGMQVNGGHVHAIDTHVRANAADSGGGVVVYGGSALFDGCSIRHNAALRGGGVLASIGEVTFRGGAIFENEAQSQGGGLRVHGGVVALHGTTLRDNRVASPGGAGGGLYANGGTVGMVECVVEGNMADGGGAAVYIGAHSHVCILRSGPAATPDALPYANRSSAGGAAVDRGSDGGMIDSVDRTEDAFLVGEGDLVGNAIPSGDIEGAIGACAPPPRSPPPPGAPEPSPPSPSLPPPSPPPLPEPSPPPSLRPAPASPWLPLLSTPLEALALPPPPATPAPRLFAPSSSIALGAAGVAAITVGTMGVIALTCVAIRSAIRRACCRSASRGHRTRPVEERRAPRITLVAGSKHVWRRSRTGPYLVRDADGRTVLASAARTARHEHDELNASERLRRSEDEVAQHHESASSLMACTSHRAKSAGMERGMDALAAAVAQALAMDAAFLSSVRCAGERRVLSRGGGEATTAETEGTELLGAQPPPVVLEPADLTVEQRALDIGRAARADAPGELEGVADIESMWI